jgi:hypothetical protein
MRIHAYPDPSAHCCNACALRRGHCSGGLGEQARTTQPSYRWPGLFEALIVVALLALTVLLFLIASIPGLALAIRTKEQAWAITIGLSAAGIILIYLGLFLPNGFLLPALRLLPPLGFWGVLLFFVPALLQIPVLGSMQGWAADDGCAR